MCGENGDLFFAPVPQSGEAGGDLLRLATQVQARTQQPTAWEGQSRHLLDRTHGPNLAGAGRRRQGAGTVFRYNSHKAAGTGLSIPGLVHICSNGYYAASYSDLCLPWRGKYRMPKLPIKSYG
jgi:hypothetical protein